MAIKLAIAGCCGRMGRAIACRALQDGTFSIAAALETAGHPALRADYGTHLGQPGASTLQITDDARGAISQGDVLIEFTTPEATVAHVALAQELRKPMVIGTTGLSEAQQAALRKIANTIPIIFSPNMSIGVNVLFELAQLAAQRLGPAYDVEVVESHHHGKKDAPSGTAKRLAELLAAARPEVGKAVPIHSVRAGDIVGDHTVILAGPSERLELTHLAQAREAFAKGALRAARFIVTQPPGLYEMSHVLKSGVR